MMAELIDPDQQEKIGFLLHKGKMEDPLGYLVTSPNSVIKFNGKL